MYARHFFHLKQIQMRHTLLFGPYIRGCSNNRPLFISLEYDAACIRRTAKKCIFACTDWHPFSYDLVPDT